MISFLKTTRYLSNHSEYCEVELRIDRTNSTDRRRRGQLRKVGSAELWFGGEMDHECYGKEESRVTEKRERGGVHRRMFKEKISSKPLAGKRRGAEFLQPVRF